MNRISIYSAFSGFAKQQKSPAHLLDGPNIKAK